MHRITDEGSAGPAEQHLGPLRPTDPQKSVPRPPVLAGLRALYPRLEHIQGHGRGVGNGRTYAAGHEVRPVRRQRLHERRNNSEQNRGAGDNFGQAPNRGEGQSRVAVVVAVAAGYSTPAAGERVRAVEERFSIAAAEVLGAASSCWNWRCSQVPGAVDVVGDALIRVVLVAAASGEVVGVLILLEFLVRSHDVVGWFGRISVRVL